MNPIKRIKTEYKRLREEDKRYKREAVYDDEGRETAALRLNNPGDAFSRFSTESDPRINPEVKEYLTAHSRGHGPLAVKVHSAGLASDGAARGTFQKTVREEFEYDCALIGRKISFNRVKSWSLVAFGVLILILSITLGFIFESPAEYNVILRTVDILAWVVLWEAFDGLLFTGSHLRMEYMKAARLRLAEFTFTE